jgi:hypothetical protein
VSAVSSSESPTWPNRRFPGPRRSRSTLVRDHHASTAAYTGRLALELDEWQYQWQQGPCLRAAAEQATVSVTDR